MVDEIVQNTLFGVLNYFGFDLFGISIFNTNYDGFANSTATSIQFLIFVFVLFPTTNKGFVDFNSYPIPFQYDLKTPLEVYVA